MNRIIMHIDMDAFFAAIEQRDRPCFKGRPLMVGALPGGRGVITTCSYEARKFGIHSAMPVSEAYKRCPQGVYVRGNLKKYAEISKKVMLILSQLSPVVEPVSIDEAYVDITGMEKLFGSPIQIGQSAKKLIFDRLRLTASVGIGPNRLIAKIASDYDKPNGICYVPANKILDFLDPLPVKCLRGVGPKMQKSLKSHGIEKIKHVRSLSESQLKEKFGETAGRMLFNQSRGIGKDRVGEKFGRKSISKERTFSEDVSDLEQFRHTMLRLASGIGRVARSKGLKGHVVQVKIRCSNFETHTRQRKLHKGTCSDIKIFDTAWDLFEKSGFSHRTLRLIGIGISDWEDRPGTQIGLFQKDDIKEKKLFEAVDRITERFGKEAIGIGATPYKRKRS